MVTIGSPQRDAELPDRVTMRDVARAAEVSVSTVSHVMNGTRTVSQLTRDRVQQALKSLGYRHRPSTRSLLAGSTRTIGLAVTVANNPYWVDLIQAVETEAARAGLKLVVADTHDDAAYEAAVVANLVAHRVDGLVIVPAAGWRTATLPLLRDQRLPFVMVDRLDHGVAVDQVGVENESAAAAVVDHLIRHGHTRIALVQGIPGLSTSAERLRGYELAHQRAGLPVDPQLIRVGDSSTKGGRRAATELLRLREPPTAIFGGNSAMTIGAMTALQSAGLSVPGDLALVGFDDFPWAELFTPALTTVAQPSAAIGARAVQLLVRRMAEPEAPPQRIRLPGEIMRRESCGCIAIEQRPLLPAPS